jgi:GAF domain-containing protein
VTNDEDRVDRVTALIAREPVADVGLAGTARLLHDLCRTAARILPVTGVAVSLMTEHGPTGIVAALDEASEVVEELQFVLGEGPCWEAFETRAPVLVPEVLGEAERRWPGYSAAVLGHGVRSAFAFPLLVGSARLGVLDVYRKQPGALGAEALANALAFAAIATRALIEGQGEANDGAAPRGVEQALESQFPVYQAQGMVMIQLGVSLGEAMARLRAHAYVQDRTLGSVARDVVARTLSLESDER